MYCAAAEVWCHNPQGPRIFFGGVGWQGNKIRGQCPGLPVGPQPMALARSVLAAPALPVGRPAALESYCSGNGRAHQVPLRTAVRGPAGLAALEVSMARRGTWGWV